MNRRAIAALSLMGTLLAGSAAQAGEPDLSEAAQAVFREALAAAAKKDWGLCRTRAAGVWDSHKNPTVAALLGVCEAELGMNREAAMHLDFFLQRDDKSQPQQTESVQKRFPQVRQKLMLLEISSVPPAEVRVDGTVMGTAPLRLFLDPGKHEVTLSLPGYASKSEQVDGTAGGGRTIELKLEPERMDAGGTEGTGAAAEGGGPSASTGVGGGSPIEPLPEPKPVWPAVLLGGVAAAGLATGIALVVVGVSKHGDAEEIAAGCQPWTTSCEQEANDALDLEDNLRAGGIVSISVGAASAVGMIVYLLVPSEPVAGAATVQPIVGPSMIGISWKGSF